MGQARYNETAILAKQGKLPPKPKKPSKRETERLLESAIMLRLMGIQPLKPEREEKSDEHIS